MAEKNKKDYKCKCGVVINTLSEVLDNGKVVSKVHKSGKITCNMFCKHCGQNWGKIQ